METINCIYFLVFYLCLSTAASDLYSDTKNNYDILLSVYKSNAGSSSLTSIIPIWDQGQALEITMDMSVYALSGFDAVAGEVEIVGSLQMSWYDHIKANKPKLGDFTFFDVTSIVVPLSTIWTPNIVLVNAVDTVEKIGSSTYSPRYNYSDGLVEWNPRVILKAACDADVTYYPFDQQTCSFIFTPWNYNSTQIKLTLSSTTMDTSQYDLNSAWSLVETMAETYISGDSYYANFTIKIQREHLYFTINIVMPILLLATMTGFVFLLPAASNERVGFSITCFLSFVVLLQTTMQFLPEVSSPMSLLCYYSIVMMMFSAVICIVTIMTLRLYQSAERGDAVPGFLKTFVQIIQCTICKRCKKSSTNDDHANLSVDWTNVGKLLDIFFFIAFLGAQGGFTFLFLLPLGLRS